MRRKTVILSNLGSPAAPTAEALKPYLRQFLMDPCVIDLPYPLRFFLVNGIIVPRRSAYSAHAYSRIWTDRGSPLLAHHLDFCHGVERILAEDPDTKWQVLPAMRYGQPDFASAVEKVEGEEILFFALYPQEARATTGSSVDEFLRVARARLPQVPVRVLPVFYEEKGFIEAFADVGRPVLDLHHPDHVLFSFHGLPESQVRKADRRNGHCLGAAECCQHAQSPAHGCYRAQCFRTAERIAAELGLAAPGFSVSFQSRLGRAAWIGPDTESTLKNLAQRGVRKLAVFCPSFVADCLETLEEIGIRGREVFREAGGEDLYLVPSLNGSEAWVNWAVQWIRQGIQNTGKQ